MKTGPKPTSAVSRVMQKIVHRDGCWIFTGCKSKRGYGKVSDFGSHLVYAHRVMFEHSTGVSAVGRVVMHSCDMPSCVNPDHLSLGTQKDNLDDARRKGRLCLRPQDNPNYRHPSQV